MLVGRGGNKRLRPPRNGTGVAVLEDRSCRVGLRNQSSHEPFKFLFTNEYRPRLSSMRDSLPKDMPSVCRANVTVAIRELRVNGRSGEI